MNLMYNPSFIGFLQHMLDLWMLLLCPALSRSSSVVKGARMAPRLASDWSSDVRSHVMVGNRGPVVKRDRGLREVT